MWVLGLRGSFGSRQHEAPKVFVFVCANIFLTPLSYSTSMFLKHIPLYTLPVSKRYFKKNLVLGSEAIKNNS